MASARALAALHGLLPAWHRRLLGETPWLLLELERAPVSGLQLRLVMPRQALPLATAALRGALPGCELLEYNPSVLEVANRYLIEPLECRQGSYTVPDRPGLGCDVTM